MKLKNPGSLTPLLRSFPSRFWQVARRRPIVATCSGLALTALLSIVFYPRTTSGANEPAYARLNEKLETLEVYNQKNEKLWELPSTVVETTKPVEESTSARYTLVADLHGDGQHEVITTLTLPYEEKAGQSLKVFDAAKNLIGERSPETISVNYQGTHYDSPYTYETLVIENIPGTNRKNIVVACNNTRSPWFLHRLDDSLNSIGKYWHFGGFYGLSTIDVKDGKKEQLVVWGINQAGPLEKGSTMAIAALLDPSKIDGDKEATATRGFGHPASTAEVFYVRFPESDIHKALDTSPRVYLVPKEGEENLRFLVSTERADVLPHFEFSLSKDFHVLDVKPSSPMISLHAALKKEGKIRSTLDKQYLEELGRRVEYWDGSRWSSEWTMVNVTTAIK
ncbi:MAG: hypothetical protein NTU47_00350 [Ignavibacteriales bacterium]|nr:hypothetical protein [Ignavibacteriales bacterium]